ncbi:MAG: hypothetical protein AAFO69_01995 [Bacteroidota bacterium]
MIKDMLSALTSYLLVTGILITAYYAKDQDVLVDSMRFISQQDSTAEIPKRDQRDAITLTENEDQDNCQALHCHYSNPADRAECINTPFGSLPEVLACLQKKKLSEKYHSNCLQLITWKSKSWLVGCEEI